MSTSALLRSTALPLRGAGLGWFSLISLAIGKRPEDSLATDGHALQDRLFSIHLAEVDRLASIEPTVAEATNDNQDSENPICTRRPTEIFGFHGPGYPRHP